VSREKCLELLAYQRGKIASIEAEYALGNRQTLAHVSAAADGACVLGAAGVDATAEDKQPGGVPFGGVGDDLGECRVEALVLRAVGARALRNVRYVP
jgi:hypothetical protein